MSLTNLNYSLQSTNKVDTRKEVIDLFLNEQPGQGTGDNCSKYYYTVEVYQNYSILLKRPVPLNKGFDFTVNTVGMNFKKNRIYSNPSHNDVINALTYVKNNNSAQQYAQVSTLINDIYLCQTCNFNSIANLQFKDYQNNNHPIAIILLAIKWLFIEQDIRYWNWSGRDMLMNTLRRNNLA